MQLQPHMTKSIGDQHMLCPAIPQDSDAERQVTKIERVGVTGDSLACPSFQHCRIAIRPPEGKAGVGVLGEIEAPVTRARRRSESKHGSADSGAEYVHEQAMPADRPFRHGGGQTRNRRLRGRAGRAGDRSTRLSSRVLAHPAFLPACARSSPCVLDGRIGLRAAIVVNRDYLKTRRDTVKNKGAPPRKSGDCSDRLAVEYGYRRKVFSCRQPSLVNISEALSSPCRILTALAILGKAARRPGSALQGAISSSR
ncbi:hypothetical protein SAMN06295987_105293 [Novosphingobium mathurense]|uniref:Uncharacterized protein n=1 Tax=Novosphingobium mathurense TaxID=428990 RepID=A0A1U6IDF4_9SPHN|nr:hypothetical protein SAMN06295987_105293 [Novosphingobium mathurense]